MELNLDLILEPVVEVWQLSERGPRVGAAAPGARTAIHGRRGAPRPAGSSPRAARGGRLPGERAAGAARAGAAAGSSAAG